MFATVYDVFAFSIVGMAIIGTVIGVFSPAAEHGLNALLDSTFGSLVWWFFSGLLAIILIAFFLTEFGATPGKWIWGIRLESKNGEALPFGVMLKRELTMFFLGFGANLGPLIIGVGVAARSYILKTGEAYWDTTYGTRTLYRENSAYRMAIGVSALLCIVLIVSVLPASQ
jgi:uncharacterized RDD family membrane protein YckC